MSERPLFVFDILVTGNDLYEVWQPLKIVAPSEDLAKTTAQSKMRELGHATYAHLLDYTVENPQAIDALVRAW